MNLVHMCLFSTMIEIHKKNQGDLRLYKSDSIFCHCAHTVLAVNLIMNLALDVQTLV